MILSKEWLDTCVDAGEFLYGFYPVSVLRQMVETKEGVSVSEEELIQAVNKPADYMMHYHSGRLPGTDGYGDGYLAPAQLEGTQFGPAMKEVFHAGNPYAQLHIDPKARKALLEVQQHFDFYIPTEQEILQIRNEFYIRTPAMETLEEKIEASGGTKEALQMLWSRISTEQLGLKEAIPSVLDLFDLRSMTSKKGSESEELEILNSLLPLVMDFVNNVNLRSRRGWTPDGLGRKRAAESKGASSGGGEASLSMGAFENFSGFQKVLSTGSYNQRRVIKVGRNDPCPCGSGKKYKKCCGR